jgi:hypothetical protein
MRAVASGAAAALLLGLVLFPGSPSALSGTPGSGTPPVELPQSFRQIDQGPAGGAVWQGPIPDRAVPAARRLTIVYLPPAVSPTGRYPVLYLLHGFRGSPYVYPFGLRFAAVADRAIESHAVRPFIAVAPPGRRHRAVRRRVDGGLGELRRPVVRRGRIRAPMRCAVHWTGYARSRSRECLCRSGGARATGSSSTRRRNPDCSTATSNA